MEYDLINQQTTFMSPSNCFLKVSVHNHDHFDNQDNKLVTNDNIATSGTEDTTSG